jgi:putative chitinase
MLNETTLGDLFPRADGDHLHAFAGRSSDLFERYGIAASPIRLHFFLAQVGHESGGLTVFTENLNYRAERIAKVWPRRFAGIEAARPCAGNPRRLANTVYGGRMGNGPPETGDGWRYRGRGYIQITGRRTYAAIGRLSGLGLVDEPDLAARPGHALLTACAFWQWRDLNALCDGRDFTGLTRRINGGTNGLRDRKAWLDKVRRLLGQAPADRVALDSARIIALQRALQDKGYAEVGAADGIVGHRTMAAVIAFRSDRGMPEGGIDEALTEVLGI